MVPGYHESAISTFVLDRVRLLPVAVNAIENTSYAMPRGSSLLTIASARVFFPATSSKSCIDVNSSSFVRSIAVLLLTRKLLHSFSTM